MTLCNKKNIVILGAALILPMLIALIFMPDGATIFMEQRCITCHRFRGEGGAAGPDLTDVGKRRSTLWLFRQIQVPRSHNPASRMPSFEHLGYLETWSLISYLKS
jgi:mono/diheme cytochrome c family protein